MSKARMGLKSRNKECNVCGFDFKNPNLGLSRRLCWGKGNLLETFWRGFEDWGEEEEEEEMVRRGEEGMKLLVGPRLPSPESREKVIFVVSFIRSSLRNQFIALVLSENPKRNQHKATGLIFTQQNV